MQRILGVGGIGGIGRAARAVVLWCLLAVMPGIAAAARFEIVGNTLVDHQTGLVWQSLSATANMPRPAPSSLIGDWRIASSDELRQVLPFVQQDLVVGTDSDLFTAIEFFAMPFPGGCDPGPSGGCFGGYFVEYLRGAQGQPVPSWLYFSASYQYTAPGSSTVLFDSINTLGSVCFSNDCTTLGGIFAVQAIPEPSTTLLMALGLLGVGLIRRRRRAG